jgi:hypothetical protein
VPDRLGRSKPDADTDVITRAAAVPALAALGVIHVVDLPGMPGPGPAGRVRVPRDHRGRDCGRRGDGSRAHRLVRAAASGLAAAMAGYVLPRALPGGFLGDHGDVGNWRCPLGIAALSALVQAASPPRPVNPRQLLTVLVDGTRQASRS